MNVSETITEAKNFICDVYGNDNANPNDASNYEIDFNDILKYNPDFAQEVLDNFEDSYAAISMALRELDFEDHRPRIYNIPKSEIIKIKHLRSKHISKFVVIEGRVGRIKPIEHWAKFIHYECYSCGNTIRVLQDMIKKKRPKQCKCGCKGMKEFKKELIDIQKIIVEEDYRDIKGSEQIAKIEILLSEGLCEKNTTKKLILNRNVRISGILKEKLKSNDDIVSGRILEAYNLEKADEDYDLESFTEKEITEFKEFSKNADSLKLLKSTIFRDIFGNDEIKEGLILQMFGGSHVRNSKNKITQRGTIHCILCGNPGSAKTMMAKRVLNYLPNSRMTDGKNSSGVGLIASVAKDDSGSYGIDIGAIPRSSGDGATLIDEMDKMNKEDCGALNNAMENLSVSIDKANIHMVLECDTRIIGTANPVNRVFDDNEPVWKQIGLPKDLLDRIDLIFPVDKIESEESKNAVAENIFSQHRGGSSTEEILSDEFVFKYIAYARKVCNPSLGTAAEEYAKENFMNLTKTRDGPYFSARLLNNIIRLTKASARMRLSMVASPEDAKMAINLVINSLKRQQIINVDGLLDYEKMEAIVPKSQRERRFTIKSFIEKQCAESMDGSIEEQDVYKKAEEMQIESSEVDEILYKLNQIGDIFNPRRGIIKVLK